MEGLSLPPLNSRVASSLLLSTFLLFCLNPLISKSLETDRLALLAIKFSITQDPTGALSSWNDSLHFCEWRGVTCNPQHQRVTNLTLRSQGLLGRLSPYIGNLTFLTGIDLQNNSFHGEIPPDFGRLLRLQYLALSNNSFEGQIPAQLSNCSNLIYVCLSSNKLEGKLPVELGSLSKLVYINLRLNGITGGIPPSFGNLSSMEHLALLYNNLEGSIPDSLSQLKRLTSLRISSNRLSGMVPPSLWNISSIIEFYFVENQLSGSLPPDIGLNLPNLRSLGLSSNPFSGSIPLSLSNASALKNFEISGNNFVGAVPGNLGELRSLKYLDLRNNHLGSGGEAVDLSFLTSLTNCTDLKKLLLEDNSFGGVLPNSIANLSTKLNSLKLGRNQISGSIPVGIENLFNLTELFIEQNLLTGSIPVSIGKLHKLERLLLHGNRLSGQISSSLGNVSQLYELRLEKNNLIGSIPLSLGNYQRLQTLDLSRNDLNGTVPANLLGSSTLLIYLNLSHNSLVGSLPVEVGSLKNLGVLDVSENRLSGEIPGTLGSCLKLEWLDFSGNTFGGDIPPALSSLRAIQHLDLSRNNLFGQIPKYLENFSSLQNLNLSFNHLEGEVPVEGVFRNTSAISVGGNENLCGGIPELQLPACSNHGPSKHENSRSFKVVVTVVAVVVVTLALITSSIILYRRRKSRKKPSFVASLGLDYPRVSYEDLLKATSGFAPANLIGAGSSGFVFKGILHQDESTIAVKVLNLQQRGASKSFMIECEALKKIRHRNLLKIITSCSSIDFKGNDFKALVFKFMRNGSLEGWLHSSTDVQHYSKDLSLGQRLNIAIDVAAALDYLHHHQGQTPIVHCDLKPSNVLLDDDMTAQVSDFGLAKFLSRATNNFGKEESSSFAIKGSIGYVAPEYGMAGEASIHGDVYSYGILVLEMFTGKRPTDDMFKDGLNLHNFSKMALHKGVMEIVDPYLLSEEEPDHHNIENQRDMRIKMEECLVSVIKIGVACSEESPSNRMDMKDVLVELNVIRDVHLGVGIHREGQHRLKLAGKGTSYPSYY